MEIDALHFHLNIIIKKNITRKSEVTKNVFKSSQSENNVVLFLALTHSNWNLSLDGWLLVSNGVGENYHAFVFEIG